MKAPPGLPSWLARRLQCGAEESRTGSRIRSTLFPSCLGGIFPARRSRYSPLLYES
jgi:hypothetical protein